MTGRAIYLTAAVAIVAGVGIGAVMTSRLPRKVDCVATGGRVDSTERHCEYGATVRQLREHIIGHATDPGLVLPILLVFIAGTAAAARRADRRRSQPSA